MANAEPQYKGKDFGHLFSEISKTSDILSVLFWVEKNTQNAKKPGALAEHIGHKRLLVQMLYLEAASALITSAASLDTWVEAFGACWNRKSHQKKKVDIPNQWLATKFSVFSSKTPTSSFLASRPGLPQKFHEMGFNFAKVLFQSMICGTVTVGVL